ncbi:MFS transporter [Streptomyces sp. enrichment culture]|uniref:MFS transporter n=1 Tax=Streptomyces sp. enrichment culture TaxID=1795815 RepID=UPI003F56EAD3
MAGILRENSDFRRFWLGDAASQFAAQAATFGLPLVALELLDPSTFEVGVVNSFATSAFLLVGLPAGVLVDRAPRLRTVMVWADVCRCALLAVLAAGALTGLLTLTQLYSTALLVGTATVLFDVAHQSYVPRIVRPEALIPGNARIAATQSVAQVAAPTAGGLVLSLVGAKALPAVLAGCFALSTGFLLRIRGREGGGTAVRVRPRMRREMAEGLGYVLRTPLLRAVALGTGWFNLFALVIQSVIAVRFVRDLGLTAGHVGLYFALGACGSVGGAMSARLWAKLLGEERVIWVASAFTAPFALLIAVADDASTFVLAGLGYFVMAGGATVYNVAQLSLRQRICPPELLGRMNASIRFLVWGTMPLGGLLGGAIGSAWSARTALVVGAVGVSCACLPLLVWSVRHGPDAGGRPSPHDDVAAEEGRPAP